MVSFAGNCKYGKLVATDVHADLSCRRSVPIVAVAS